MKQKVNLLVTVTTLAAVLLVTLASCGLLANGDETKVSVNLPYLSQSARALTDDVNSRLKNAHRSFRVHMNDKVLEGTGGHFSASFPIGLKVDVYVESLNSKGEVIVRTVTKSIVVSRGENRLSFNMKSDGDEIVPPPVSYTITFSAGTGPADVQMPSQQSVVSGGTSQAWTNPTDGMKGSDRVFFTGWKITATDGAIVNVDAGAITSYAPTQDVTLTAQWLWMSDHEVTQKEWKDVMGNDGNGTATPQNSSTDYGKGDNYPMYYVSWYDALVYCNKLSKQENRTPCYTIKNSTDTDTWGTVPDAKDNDWDAVTCDFNANGYRLPTEAEWEYMAKGGENHTYSGSDNINDVAWYTSNSNTKSHEVKGKNPNKYGMYDMSGNIREWCWDWYTSGSHRVGRGGSWYNVADICAVSDRSNLMPSNRSYAVGFRVVRCD